MFGAKKMVFCLTGLCMGLALTGVAGEQPSATTPTPPGKTPALITTKRFATGFVNPVFCGAPVGDFQQLFVVEQGGRLKILSLVDGSQVTFLDISSLIATGGERGLLGLAFHPHFMTNRRFYVNFTGIAAGETRIVEYLANATGPPVQADAASARLIMTFSQPQENHNGGWLGFGPDGFLYIATGDGGNGNDTGPGHTDGTGNAQDITNNFLGKLLRINVNRDDFPDDPNRNYGIPRSNPFVNKDGDDEIWAYGLRNPWRNSFDRETGDLYIGDVGQDTREEIDFQPHSSTGGENYGWRLREGKIATPATGIGGHRPPGNVDPVVNYNHGSGSFAGEAVVGGYVYRGPIVGLRGTYFYADFVNSRIWSIQMINGTVNHFTDWTDALKPDVGAINNVSSFGEDAAGNLYIVDFDGELFRIVRKASGQSLQAIARDAILRILTQPPTRGEPAR